MSRWFRFYDDALDDEKVQLLPDSHFRAWVNLLCLASKNEGVLPPLEAIAFRLRKPVEEVSAILNEFYRRQLLDHVELPDAPISYSPHNWKKRQYKTDVTDPTAAERARRYRGRNANRDDDRDASVTDERPETDNREQIQKDSEAIASGADAPNPRQRLFGDDGLGKLRKLTGKGPDACRSFIGKCLKAADDDAVVVLGLIEDAERNEVANASAWIVAHLPNARAGPAKPLTEFQRKQAETNDVRAKLRNIGTGSGPAAGVLPVDHGERPATVRDGDGAVVRLIPPRSG